MADEPPLPNTNHQTETPLEIEGAQHTIEWCTRQVTANMLRIIAGAGRPFDLFEQMRHLHQAIGSVPPETLVGHITNAMVAALEENDDKPVDYFDRPIARIEQGALRKAAGRLLGQRTHEAAGDSLMWEGIREIERGREDKRREREAARPRPVDSAKRAKRQTRAAPTTKPEPRPKLQPPVASDQKLPGESTYDYMKRQSGRTEAPAD